MDKVPPVEKTEKSPTESASDIPSELLVPFAGRMMKIMILLMGKTITAEDIKEDGILSKHLGTIEELLSSGPDSTMLKAFLTRFSDPISDALRESNPLTDALRESSPQRNIRRVSEPKRPEIKIVYPDGTRIIIG